jgi:hypothetical protein
MHQSMSCAGRNGAVDIRRWQQTEDKMHAIVRASRIDIEGSDGIAKETWEPLLDDLKAVHMPSLTPRGKRLMVPLNSITRLVPATPKTVIYST